MVPIKQKTVRFYAISLLLENSKWTSMTYIYKNVETVFEESFTVRIESMHDYLFETITILVKKGKKVLSGMKVSIKSLKTMEYTGVPLMTLESIELSSPCNAVGFINFTLAIATTPLKFKESRQRLPNILLNTVFNRFMSDFVARIFNLAFVIQEGKLKYKIRALLGFMATQILSSKLFRSCNGAHEGSECQDEDCFKRYGGISVRKAKQGLKALHYSAIAYSNAPLPIFAPRRLRKVQNTDPVKARILSHADISEADILKVYAGSLDSAAFTAFFDSSQLVVTFRGTCTANELLNALDSRYFPFLGGFAHSGMLRLAKRFLEDEWVRIRQAMGKRKCKSVLFTGHSLGGAVAIMVYLILKDHGSSLDDACLVRLVKSDMKKMQTKVLAFSVPPCVSRSIAFRNLPEIVVFNYERDTIPQLSFGSILDLKYLCLSIVFRRVLHCVLFYRRSQIVAEINHVRALLRSSNIHEKLFCPGTIYHIRAVRAGGRMVYKYRIVSPAFYGEIKHYVNSLLSHIMTRISDALEHTINRS